MELESNEENHLSLRAQEDYALIKRALEHNDQKAYTKLMDRYKDSVYFMLLKMVHNPDFAEDLTMETFGKAFKSLDNYIPKNAFSTWLFKIAVNNCIDFVRRKREKFISMTKGQSMDKYEEQLEIRAILLDPEQSAISKQGLKRLRTEIEKLKPHYKTLIHLRYFGDYSYQEIADELCIPIGTVKAQLSRAKDVLQELITQPITENLDKEE